MNLINLVELSTNFRAWKDAKTSGNKEREDESEDKIDTQLKDLPSGSGIDAGMKLDWDKSKPEKLIFLFSFHHMNEAGYYDGWTDHKLIITPSFSSEFELRITGRNRNQVKDYLYDLFYLTFVIDHTPVRQVA